MKMPWLDQELGLQFYSHCLRMRAHRMRYSGSAGGSAYLILADSLHKKHFCRNCQQMLQQMKRYRQNSGQKLSRRYLIYLTLYSLSPMMLSFTGSCLKSPGALVHSTAIAGCAALHLDNEQRLRGNFNNSDRLEIILPLFGEHYSSLVG